MSLTSSSLLGVGGTLFEAASFSIHLGAMRNANSSLNTYIGTPDLKHPTEEYRFLFAPCVTQILLWLPDLACLVHPSWWLLRFCFAPCMIHTPPFTTWLVHPSWWVHCFTFAPLPFTTAWKREINSILIIRMALCWLMLEEMRVICELIIISFFWLWLTSVSSCWEGAIIYPSGKLKLDTLHSFEVQTKYRHIIFM